MCLIKITDLLQARNLALRQFLPDLCSQRISSGFLFNAESIPASYPAALIAASVVKRVSLTLNWFSAR